MYNRYIPGDTSYERIPEQETPPSHAPESQRARKETHRPPMPPPLKGAGPLEGITGRLGGLLKNIHLEELDSGDILLVLILLFLFLESDDNLELVITLGLLLVFGLFGKDDKEED
mgnify:CR=1 FL=1